MKAGTIAVNILDLAAAMGDPLAPGITPAGLLLNNFCDEASPTVLECKKGQIDSGGIILDRWPACENTERVTALVSLLQTSIGPRKIGRRIRCYRLGPRGGWSEIVPPRE